jgi:hypothetical protein
MLDGADAALRVVWEKEKKCGGQWSSRVWVLGVGCLKVDVRSASGDVLI